MKRAAPSVDLSIVVPVYNEVDNLEALVRELLAVLSQESLEILLIDDGSEDGSAETIAKLASTHPEVRGLHFGRNHGQTAAFDAGFRAARGRCVVTVDADLQNDPRDIPRLLAALRDHDAAVGYRRKRRDPWSRRISSRIANAVRNRLSGDDIIDTGCSLKAFRRECLQELRLFDGMHRFLPTLLRMQGYRVVQMPVNHRLRVAGKSKYGACTRGLRAFIDLLAVRWMKKRRLDYEIVRREP